MEVEETQMARFENGYTGDGFTIQQDEDFAEQEACDRAVEPSSVPWVEVDTETAYGSTQRIQRSIRVF